ncbi:MAG: hypothetical protein KKE16_04805 [Firmicutes bacterium]|nr:hypothetical protein [Bacillota bacterium]
MAKTDKSIQKESDNFTSYRKSVGEAFHKELKLYEDFYSKITHRATTHRQITLNNLTEIEEKLDQLKKDASQIKHSLFFHEEYEIVDRQEIISHTEMSAQNQNQSFLEYHYQDKNEILNSLDYLNKALIQTRTSFFDQFQRTYLENIFENESLFNYFLDSSKEFNQILDRHQSEILELFLSLDEEIKNMDDSISQIIKRKNRTVSKSNHFYENEMKFFIDNQLLFSAEADPTSVDIQALISDKIRQFEVFKKHVQAEDEKITRLLNNEYCSLFDQVLARQLNQKSNLISNSLHFFEDPEKSLEELKMEVLRAQEKNDKIKLREAIQLYQKAQKYIEIKKQSEKRTESMLKKFEKEKKAILLEYRINSNKITTELERYLTLFEELMDKDTFLAQAIGDSSSKIIKDELNRLSILQLNKELKTNINYDIESLKIKSRINEIEMEMSFMVKKQMLLQEIELLETVNKVQLFLLNHKASYVHAKMDIQKESKYIGRLERALNVHLAFLHETSDISRKIQSEFYEKVIRQIRSEETHHIHVQEASSKLKFALKEYDIKAIHFKTMMENELAYIVMQSSRVSEENQIHHEFILTTYENQMRFSKEQIELAESEYRIRIEALQRTVNEEKTYFDDLIRNKMQKYEKNRKQAEHEYESKLYQNRHLLSETSDPKIHKILEKEAKDLKKNHEEFLTKWSKEMMKDPLVESAKNRIQELEEDFLDAMEDAKKLRDETLLQMVEIYEDAKNHFEVLKPFLDNKMNVLDPEFYHMLERINERYHYKLKLAEAILDQDTQELLDAYVKVYFEPQVLADPENYRPLLNSLISAREEARQRYEEKMKQIENDFLQETSLLEQEEIRFDESLNNTKLTQKAKYESSRKSLETEVDQLSLEYETAQSDHSLKRTTSINTLTEEYESALINNQKYIKSLTIDFNKILKSYQPYIKIQKKNKDIRKILSTNRMIFKTQLKKTKKELKKRTKAFEFTKKHKTKTDD